MNTSTAASSKSTSRTRGSVDGNRARPALVATQIAAAPSVSSELLPAVSVPCPLVLSNAGASFASLASDVSGRGKPSFVTSRNGRIRSSKKPRVCAATACSWLASATSSCSWRPTCQVFAISSVCSPMLFPVTRFLISGICNQRSDGLNAVRTSSRRLKSRAWTRCRSQSERSCPSPIWTRLMLSTPPASASSRPLPSMPATSKTPAMLVLHCMMVVNVGTCGSSLASSQISRARLL